VRAAIAEAERLRSSSGDSKLLEYLGNAYRLLGDFRKAISCFEERLRDTPTDRDRQRALIGLGEALRCADRFAEAEARLRTALSLGTDYEDFALQHLGKTLLDAGKVTEGRACLDRALALRQRKGDAELIGSTRLALARADELGAHG
jgi:tetratricopeptide (TPR) repeat protein